MPTFDLTTGPAEAQSDDSKKVQAVLDLIKMVASLPREDAANIAVKSLGHEDLPVRVAGFYILHLAAQEVPAAGRFFAPQAEALAHHILNYIIAACLGEARYAKDPRTPIGKAAVAAARRYGCSRDTIWVAGLLLAANEEMRHEILSQCLTEFREGHWGRSYGGRRWADVARYGLRYLSGQMSPTLFVDGIIDIVHNNGWAFNKYFLEVHNCGLHWAQLRTVLDIKASSDLSPLVHCVCLPRQVEHPWVEMGLKKVGVSLKGASFVDIPIV